MTYNDYRKQAIYDLNQYNEIKNLTARLKSRISFLQSGDLYSVPTFDDRIMKSRDSDSSMAHHITHIDELQAKLHYCSLYCANMENCLNSLTSGDRELLTSFYIERTRNTVLKMAQNSYHHRTTIYRKVQKALDRYIESYFGVSKSDFPDKE